MATWPSRNQQAPNYWDDDLKDYIDAGDAASGSMTGLSGIVALTQTAYDALDPADSTVLYVITGA